MLWQPREGAHSVTAVVKATYDLTMGVARLSRVQEFPNDEDNHWNDDPRCSLYSASDLAPFKPRADVVLVGDAQLPEGRTARALVARMTVGSIDKAIEVCCDRHIDPQGHVVEGEPFNRMPLRYERAAAGYDNPVGVPRDVRPDALGRRRLPNLQPVAANGGGASVIAPVGFGPIAECWRLRRDRLGANANVANDPTWLYRPLPRDLDAHYFSCAPVDQTLEVLHADEVIVLENLHPDHQRLECRLPGVKPRVFALRNGVVRELRMLADTLWIDTTRSVCTLTWRGRFKLRTPNDVGRVFVALEEPGTTIGWTDVARRLPDVGDLRGAERAEAEPHSAAPATVGTTFRPRASTLPFIRRRGRGPQPVGAEARDKARGPEPRIPAAPPVSPGGAQPSPWARHDGAGDVPAQPLVTPASTANGPAASALAPSPQKTPPAPSTSSPAHAPPLMPEPPALLSHPALVDASGGGGRAAPAPPRSTAALELLFIDDERVSSDKDAALLRALVERPADVEPVDELQPTDWARPANAADVDVAELVERALADGVTTALPAVGFRLAGDAHGRLLKADWVRVEATFSPVLCPVQLLRAKLRIAALALSPLDGDRASSLRSMLELITDDLTGAPEEVWTPALRELERSCDAAEGRPSLGEVCRQAEAVVLAKRGLSRVELRDGAFVAGELSDGEHRTTAYVSEAHVPSLPTTSSWPAVALGQPQLGPDGTTTAIVLLALGRMVDRAKIPLLNPTDTTEPSHESVRARPRER